MLDSLSAPIRSRVARAAFLVAVPSAVIGLLVGGEPYLIVADED